MPINMRAETVYRLADSVIISAAKRGCVEAPGIRDTKRIRVTMIIVESVVVLTDKVYVVTCISVERFTGTLTGATFTTKSPMPVTKIPCQHTSNLQHTDLPMDATFKMKGIASNFQLQLQMIQQRQT